MVLATTATRTLIELAIATRCRSWITRATGILQFAHLLPFTRLKRTVSLKVIESLQIKKCSLSDLAVNFLSSRNCLPNFDDWDLFFYWIGTMWPISKDWRTLHRKILPSFSNDWDVPMGEWRTSRLRQCSELAVELQRPSLLWTLDRCFRKLLARLLEKDTGHQLEKDTTFFLFVSCFLILFLRKSDVFFLTGVLVSFSMSRWLSIFRVRKVRLLCEAKNVSYFLFLVNCLAN